MVDQTNAGLTMDGVIVLLLLIGMQSNSAKMTADQTKTNSTKVILDWMKEMMLD